MRLMLLTHNNATVRYAPQAKDESVYLHRMEVDINERNATLRYSPLRYATLRWLTFNQPRSSNDITKHIHLLLACVG